MDLQDLPLDPSEKREVMKILRGLSERQLEQIAGEDEDFVPPELLGPPFNLRPLEVAQLARRILRQRMERRRRRERERERQRQREQQQEQSEIDLPVNPLAVVVIIVVLIFGVADRSEPEFEDDGEEEEET